MKKANNPINCDINSKKSGERIPLKPQKKASGNRWFDECTSIITGETVVIGLDEFIKEMLGYARDNIDATITDFLCQKQVPDASFDRWCDRHPKLQEAYDQFNNMIADTLERNARKKGDIGFTMRSMSYYSKKWRKFDKERQESKNTQSITGNATITYDSLIGSLKADDNENSK